MFERKIYNDIVSWHESLKIKKRALIIKGLRQIGKTTIVRKFCEEHYENVVYIDFMHNSSVKSLFDKDLNVNDLIISLSASNLGAKFIPYKTIIILMNYKNVQMLDLLLNHLWKMVDLILFVLDHFLV